MDWSKYLTVAISIVYANMAIKKLYFLIGISSDSIQLYLEFPVIAAMSAKATFQTEKAKGLDAVHLTPYTWKP